MSEPSEKQALLMGLGSLVVVALAAFLFSRPSSIRAPQLVGKRAPRLEFVDPGGQLMTLSEFSGKVILVNFWAHWCLPCVEEMPSLALLEKKLGNDFVLLAIHVGGGADPEAIDRRLYPRNLIFQVAENQLGPYGISGIPHSVLIDREGIVRKIYQGPRDWISPPIRGPIEALLGTVEGGD